MDDLISFLRAQYDADDAAARTAFDRLNEHADAFDDDPEDPWTYARSWEGFGRSGWTETAGSPISAHIARWDPARVLREVEAKRRILDLWAEEWAEWHGHGSALVRTRMTDDQYLRVLDAERVLSLLALPYADRPDYRQEWRP